MEMTPRQQSPNFELSIACQMEMARAMIESKLAIAKRFQRNEEEAYNKILAACERPGFAEAGLYRFPRGNKEVSDISINGATELARVWGNIDYGCRILREDEQTVLIQGYAFDKESNTEITSDDTVKKLIQRRGQNGSTKWIVPDERDLRELIAKRASIAIRNCILKLMPRDWRFEIVAKCKETIVNDSKTTDAIGKMIKKFGQVGVTLEMIEKRLGHQVKSSSPEEIAEFRQIYQAIEEGATWQDFEVDKQDEQKQPNQEVETLKDLAEKKKGQAEKPQPETAKTKSPAQEQKSAQVETQQPPEPSKKETMPPLDLVTQERIDRQWKTIGRKVCELCGCKPSEFSNILPKSEHRLDRGAEIFSRIKDGGITTLDEFRRLYVSVVILIP